VAEGAERLAGLERTKMVRYADDLVVLCRWRPAESYMPKLRAMLARLRVIVNEDKTRIVSASAGFDFPWRTLPQAADTTRPAVLLLLAFAPLDAACSG
jgi:hypothetical protein